MEPMKNRSRTESDVCSWPAARAWEWYRDRPWIVGCNYIPRTASNQLEMWQQDTFDPDTIAQELDLAAGIGLNTVRIFLHDVAWRCDDTGLTSRLDEVLDLAADRRIRAIVVLFDGVWTNRAHPGPQPDPIPGIHNSTWLQSPHPKHVIDPMTWAPLERYVTGIIERFDDDDRILMWDLYNEPGNEGLIGNALPFLQAVFGWARSTDATQPLTASLWNWEERFDELNRYQIAASDIITFHTYESVAAVRTLIEDLFQNDKPLVCTEYMARTMDSRFETHMPLFKDAGIGCLNWGLVSGRTQTIYPWDSDRGSPEPETWFHDIFRPDGTAYDAAELRLIRDLTTTPNTDCDPKGASHGR